MSQTTLELPKGYARSGELDFDGDKKAKVYLYAAAFLIMAILFFLGNTWLPVYLVLYDAKGQPAGLPSLLLKLGVLILFLVFYSLIHEKIHAYFMQRFSGAKAQIGFKGSAAFAGSDAYFSKKDFAVIALAPVVLSAAVIFLITLILTPDWFGVGYIAQMINLAGSAGDFYSALKISQQPPDLLIHNSGMTQTYYVLAQEAGTGRSTKKTASSAKSKKKQNIYGRKRKK